jgi:hypothetical protein
MFAPGACANMIPAKELMEPVMKRPKPSSPVPQHDYGLALQTAVSWLGDRYLLAEPVSRRIEVRKPFFFEPRQWYQARRTVGPGSRKH